MIHNSKNKTNSTGETRDLAEKLAKEILASPLPRDSALIFALRGDLGGGKTTFVQGFAKGLGVEEKITSPTFNIFKKYQIKSRLSLSKIGSAYFYCWLYHFDCYRIEKPEEILALGFREIIADPQNIIAIEWAEKIKKILPKNTHWLNFKFIDDSTRTIDIL